MSKELYLIQNFEFSSLCFARAPGYSRVPPKVKHWFIGDSSVSKTWVRIVSDLTNDVNLENSSLTWIHYFQGIFISQLWSNLSLQIISKVLNVIQVQGAFVMKEMSFWNAVFPLFLNKLAYSNLIGSHILMRGVSEITDRMVIVTLLRAGKTSSEIFRFFWKSSNFPQLIHRFDA